MKLSVATLALCVGAVIAGNRPAIAQQTSTPFSGSPVTLPGTVSAANFDNGGQGVAYYDTTPGNSGGAFRATDVDIEVCSEGGYDVGWIAASEWLNFTVNVTSAGTYTAALRVASPGGGTLHIGFNGPSNVWKSVSIPATGAWQAWTTVNVPVTVNAGIQQITLYFDTGAYNISTITVVSAATPTSPPAALGPYTGTPVPIPGVVSAANFDNGGEGLGYSDTTPGNSGGAYRDTDVDIEVCSEGGYDVGWIAATEWLNYTVNVTASGTYTAQLRVASPSGGGSLNIAFNGSSVSQSVSVPATGGWQNWTTVSVPVTLSAGTQQLSLYFYTGGFNVSSITVTGTPTPTPPPATGTPLPVIEWNIEVDDSSEAHARTAMDILVASAPRPEVIVIVEAYSEWFSTYINELENQTGQTWYGAFATHCASGNWNGSACTSTWDQGVGIFSTHPIISTDSMMFPYADCWTSARVGLRAQIDVGGLPVHVFTTHLQTGGCADDATSRYNSMRDLKAWAAHYSTPQLVAGDFNADPDQIDTTSGMLPAFVDSWPLAGTGSKFTALLPSPTMKLDYWFADAGGRANPSISVVDTGSGSVSDHYPLQAVFIVQ